jgi:NAD(P)H dehydrogenase (quinone)
VTMVPAYGSAAAVPSGEESSLLLKQGSMEGEESPLRQKLRPPTSARTTLLLFAILFSTFYLALVGHNILFELRASQSSTKPYSLSSQGWTNLVDHALLPVSETLYYSEVVSNANHADNTVDPADAQQVIILIVHGPHGDKDQEAMANRVADGARSISNTLVLQESIATASFQQILQADAVILGASVENANTHHKVQQWINENWDMQHRKDMIQKVGGAFVTAGGISAGEEGTLHRLLESMLVFGMIVVGGNDWTSAFGASAVTYEAPFQASPPPKSSSSNDDNDANGWFVDSCYNYHGEVIHPMFLAKAYGLGVRVATVAKQLSSAHFCHQ